MLKNKAQELSIIFLWSYPCWEPMLI